jgi:xylulokinase
LYDLERDAWWAEMLERLELTPDRLPRLSAGGSPAGTLRREVAEMLGLPAETLVAVGTLDHLAAAVGTGNTRPGRASLSTGTASCVVVTRGERPQAVDGGVIGRHPAATGLWYALTWSGLSSTGLNWYARQVGAEDRLGELLDDAASVPPGADGWTARPRDAGRGDAGFDFTHRDAGFAPGTTQGPAITPPSDGQAMRAILDCLCQEVRALLDRAAGGEPVERLTAIGGGARSNIWPSALPHALGIPVELPHCSEASARGAALLAAHAAGLVPSLVDGWPDPPADTLLPEPGARHRA